MKKKLTIVICIALALGVLFRPQLTLMKDLAEAQLFLPLSGVRIVLDAGHGGRDGGAEAHDIQEKTINLAIAKQTKQRLREAGATVYLTREDDYDLASDGVKNRKRDDMKQRVLMINDKEVDLFISIHLNAFPNASVKGSQVYFRKRDPSSEQFAKLVQSHFKTITETKMVPKAGDFYILNETNKLGVLAECGFISNAKDRSLLVDKAYQGKIADVFYKSICDYFQMME